MNQVSNADELSHVFAKLSLQLGSTNPIKIQAVKNGIEENIEIISYPFPQMFVHTPFRMKKH